MTTPLVEIDAATILELQPPCEMEADRLPCCARPADWIVRTTAACGHRGIALLCDLHWVELRAWLAAPLTVVSIYCLTCNRPCAIRQATAESIRSTDG